MVDTSDTSCTGWAFFADPDRQIYVDQIRLICSDRFALFSTKIDMKIRKRSDLLEAISTDRSRASQGSTADHERQSSKIRPTRSVNCGLRVVKYCKSRDAMMIISIAEQNLSAHHQPLGEG